MEKRKLGHTGFEVAPLAFGGNVFGWTVDEATSFRLLDAFCGCGLQSDRHRGFVFALGAGPPGRGIGDDNRPLDSAARPAR